MAGRMSSSVAVFWDYENCALPALEPSFAVVNAIRRLAHHYGSVKIFKAYLEYPEQTSMKSMALRSELQSCGVSLIDCPHNGRKDVADKMIMVDMMAHAIDTPAPATIILISGDRDFVYAVSILGFRQYRIVLLAPRAAHSSLKAQADAVYNWPDDLLIDISISPFPTSLAEPIIRQTGITSSGPLEDCLKKHHVTTPDTSTPSSFSNVVTSEKPFEPASNNVDDDAAEQTPNHVQMTAPVPEVFGTPEDPEGRVPSASDSLENEASYLSSPVTQSPKTEARDPVNGPGPSVLSSWTHISRPVPSRTRSAFGPPSPIIYRSATPEFRYLSGDPSSSALRRLGGLNAFASPFVPPTSPSKSQDRGDDGDGNEWQTYSRAAKKPRAPGPPTPPQEFKPLVKVLKRQHAEGVERVESSQLGQFLSQEVQHLGVIYERANTTRLKEYTALAARKGIVIISPEGADGHYYISLHPAYRFKAATVATMGEHVWG